MMTTQATEVFLLAIGGEAIFDDFGAGAVRTGDDFGNRVITLATSSPSLAFGTPPAIFEVFLPGDALFQ